MHQDTIWAYFQNRHPEIFEGATARMDFILRDIARKKDCFVPKVLNIGVGNGYFELSAKKLGWKIVSLDPDRDVIEWLLKKEIAAHQGRIEDMSFSEDSLDFVVASEVLEHLNDEQLGKGLSETVKVLRKGGWFIGTVPYCEDLASNEVICPRCQEVFHRWGHQTSFDLNSMRSKLLSYFSYVFVKRRCFVSLHERDLVGKIKGITRLILAHYGVSIAIPNLYFAARK